MTPMLDACLWFVNAIAWFVMLFVVLALWDRVIDLERKVARRAKGEDDDLA